MKLKDCIRYLVMLAFVLTTMPTIGHAETAAKTLVKVEQTQAQQAKGEHDCCPKAKKADKKEDCSDHMAMNKGQPHPDKNGCCDKNGKCVSNTCTSSAKISSFNTDYLYSPMAAKTTFSLSQEGSATGLFDRIKRPPRTQLPA